MLSARVTKTVLLVIAILVFSSSHAGKGPNFDFETFNERYAVVLWLLDYDRTAWLTTDLVFQEPEETLDKLGSEWFCLPHEDVWHAVYGKYNQETESYEVVLHYKAGAEEFEKSDDVLPQTELDAFSRALHMAGVELVADLGPFEYRFNQYVRRIESEAIEVWILPGWQQDGLLVYGFEHRFVFDPEGRKILESSISKSDLLTDRPDPAANWILDNSGAKLPSVGQLFTMMLVRRIVPAAGIRNKKYTSVMLDLPDPTWVQIFNKHDLENSIEAFKQIAADGRLDE